MIDKYSVTPKQAQVLRDLEDLIGKTIPPLNLYMFKIDMSKFGVSVEDDNVTILELCNQGLTSLPESIGYLTSLQKLSLRENSLLTLPEAISKLESLKILDLHNNQLTALPEAIGKLKSLTTLFLNNNSLENLPESLINLTSLKTLKFEGNNITELPQSIELLKERGVEVSY